MLKMKRLVLLSLILFPIFLFAQYPTFSNKQKLGVQTTGDGLIFRGTTVNNIPNYIPSNVNNAYFHLDTTTSKLYLYSVNTWQQIYPTASDTTSDTTSLGAYLLKSDTLSMLLPYLRKADTISLSNRINLKLNISDTTILSNRITTNANNIIVINNKLNTKLDTIYKKLKNVVTRVLNKDTLDLGGSLTEGYGINIIGDSINVDTTIIFTQSDTITLSNRINNKLNATDTVSLSNRINLKLNKTDTINLSNRIDLKLNPTDTISLSNRINIKLNPSDTVSLSNRINTKLNTSDTISLSNRINKKLDTIYVQYKNYLDTIVNKDTINISNVVLVSDTASMLNPYLRKLDTISLSNRIDLRVKYADTTNMLLPYFRTNDTTLLNLNSRLSIKLNLSDTASMLSKYVNTYSNQTEINGDKTFNNVITIDSATVTGKLLVNTNISDAVKINSNTNSTNLELMNSGGSVFIKSGNKNMTLQTDTTALVYLKGDVNRVGILTMNPQQALEVAGTIRVDSLGNNLTPVKLVGGSNSNDLTNVALGTGLSFVNDTLKIADNIINSGDTATLLRKDYLGINSNVLVWTEGNKKLLPYFTQVYRNGQLLKYENQYTITSDSIVTLAVGSFRLKDNITIIAIDNITALAGSGELITLQGNVSGSGTNTINTTINNGVVTNTMLAGGISNDKLDVISTAGKVNNSATTATNLNTVNAIVSRNASGNFSAGIITASLNGNATTATTATIANGVQSYLSTGVIRLATPSNAVSPTITVPDVNASMATTNLSQTFGGTQTFSGTAVFNNQITGSISGSSSSVANALTINAPLTGTSYNGSSAVSIGLQAATTSVAGSMSAADKTKLDGIAAGATANTGTVTSVSGTGTVSGLTLTGTVTTTGNLTLGGTLSLTSGNVTSALGFTPYNATNPAGYITSSSLSSYLPLTGGTVSGTINRQEGNNDSQNSIFYYNILNYFAKRDNVKGGATAQITFTDKPGTYNFPVNVRTSDIYLMTAHNYNGSQLGQYLDTTLSVVANQDGGRIGISNLNPAYKLDVNGTFNASGNSLIGGTLGVTGVTTFSSTVNGITKSMVGLSNVDNTTDAGKPVSTATQTALDLKLNLSDPAVDYYISNSGSGAYLVNGVSNGNIYFEKGKKYRIHVNASGHPFWIQTVSGAYSSGNVYSTGITNNGTQSGYIIVELALNAPQLYYACEYHSSMVGLIITGTTFQTYKALADLSNVNNTTDINKPISTATQTALDLKQNTLSNASTTVNGILTAANFTIFNNKQNALNGTGFVKASGTTISYDNTSYLPLTGGTLSSDLNVLGNISVGSLSQYTGQSTRYLKATNISPYIDLFIGSLGTIGTWRGRIHFQTSNDTETPTTAMMINEFGNINMNGTLGVTGATTLSNILTINSGANVNSLSINNTALNNSLSMYSTSNSSFTRSEYKNGSTGSTTSDGLNVGYYDGGYFVNYENTKSYLYTNNNTNQLVLDTDGNVGVGIDDATNKLDINGTLRVRTTNTVSPTTILGRDNNGVVGGVVVGSGLSLTSGTLSLASGGGFITTNNNYTITITDSWIVFNNSFSNITVTLPDATTSLGRTLYFRNTAAGSIVSAGTANVINNTVTTGSPTNDILGAGNTSVKWCTLVSNGTYWIKMQAGSL